MKNIGIIGLGLMGGSFALALREKRPKLHFIGFDRNEENAQKALELGIVDEIAEFEDTVQKSDLIVLAAPIHIIQRLLPLVMNQIKEDAIVIDLGSTKQEICESIENHAKRKNFVATHPIAGTENSGPESAFPELYKDKTVILCDVEKSSDTSLKTVEEIYREIGMDIIQMNSISHDLHIAYVSHLSHISSFALGQTVLKIEKNEKTIFDMAGSGFESTVRLAKSSPDMWTPIFIHNRDNLIKAINAYQAQLEQLKNLIIQENEYSIHKYLEEANDIRRILNREQKSINETNILNL